MNGLDFFMAPCGCQFCVGRVWERRDWGQFLRFYETVSQITGSYTQAVQVTDPEVVAAVSQMKPSRDDFKVQPPRWWRFDDVMHRLTDIADQLIASRAHSDDVKFYPRPINPAAKARAALVQARQDDEIERSRRANMERRGLNTIKY